MEKRILVAFLLSLAVLYGFRQFYTPPTPAPVVIQGSAPPAAQQPAAGPATQPQEPASTPGSLEQPPQPVVEIGAQQDQEVTYDTTLYTATFASRGGVLKSFKPKQYTDTDGKPIELIDAAGGTKLGWPLALTTGDAALDEVLKTANFAITQNANEVVLEFAARGVHARKNVAFDPENYTFSIVSSVTRDNRALPHAIVWQGGFGDQSIAPVAATHQLVYPNGSSYKRLAVAGIEPQEMTVARFGVEDQYFLAMFLLPGNGGAVKISHQEYTGANSKPVATAQFSVPATEQPIRVYVGPKDPKWLTKADPQLAPVVDYGFFGFIAKPLTFALLWLHSFIGNFGWSIIALTVLINLALFPLRLKQQVSMQKMQKVQPQMKTLQDRYKKLKANDPKRVEVQAQMMGLYKEHGINPMSGCLPLLLQMPFLIAFYSMLQVSIELRHAPWMLWISDLSQPDRFFVMPILMAVSMIVTQKMTPTTVDPAQAKMMMIMPLVMTVLFLWSQSGLMLYWLTSNVVGIGQQFFINKYWAAAPAGRNQVKRIEPVE